MKHKDTLMYAKHVSFVLKNKAGHVVAGPFVKITDVPRDVDWDLVDLQFTTLQFVPV